MKQNHAITRETFFRQEPISPDTHFPVHLTTRRMQENSLCFLLQLPRNFACQNRKSKGDNTFANQKRASLLLALSKLSEKLHYFSCRIAPFFFDEKQRDSEGRSLPERTSYYGMQKGVLRGFLPPGSTLLTHVKKWFILHVK